MRRRPGLKLLGLSALVMGVMAVGTAGSARAETGACWGYTSGSLQCFSTVLEAKPLFAVEGAGATLLVGSVNIEITCTTAAFIEGGTLSANGSILLGRLEFGGCFSRTKTALGALGACTPEDPVAGLGKIRTEKLTGLIVLHTGSEPVLLINDDTETPEQDTLVRLFMPECAVATELIIRGELILADFGGKAGAEKHALSHLVIEHPTLKGILVGGVAATIDGSINVTLAAPHNALLWGSKTTK